MQPNTTLMQLGTEQPPQITAIPPPKSACCTAVHLHTLLPFSAGCSLQTAHLRPQLRLGPCHKGWPSDPGNLHPEPPHQEHERCQLVPDHHSTESGQSEIRCVESSDAQSLCTSLEGRCISCRTCGTFHALFLERCLSVCIPSRESFLASFWTMQCSHEAFCSPHGSAFLLPGLVQCHCFWAPLSSLTPGGSSVPLQEAAAALQWHLCMLEY